MEDKDISAHTYSQLIFLINKPKMHSKEKIAFSQIMLLELDEYIKKSETSFSSPILHESQLQIDQEPWHKTWHPELDKGEIEHMLELLGTEENFLNRTLITQALKSTINKRDLMKIKCSDIAKTPSFEWRQSTAWERGISQMFN